MNLSKVSSQTGAELVAQLAERCWRAHYTSIIGGPQVDYMLSNFQSSNAIVEQIANGRDYYVIEDDKPLGYLATDLKPDHLFLSKLYILPEFMGMGHGRWAIKELAASHPGLPIHLTVNKHNHGTIAFYERLGFRKEGPVVADIGNGFFMDDWKMQRP